MGEPLELDDPARHRALVTNSVPRVKEYADDLLNRLIREGKLAPTVRPQVGAENTRDLVHLHPPQEHHEAIARAFCAHLIEARDLKYSTKLRRENKAIDPIEEFLFHSRVGHCERFASALVLLLRSQRIPAVLVLGFKGCEQTEPGRYIVRQDHAHAWVEALVSRPGDPARQPLNSFGRKTTPPPDWYWLSLDPEPAAETVESAASGTTWWERMTATLDQYLLDYSPQQRNRALRTLGQVVTSWEFLAAVGGLLALALAIGYARRRLTRVPPPPKSELSRWFDRLLTLLAAHGYSPRPGETLQEFADSVRERLRAVPTMADHADVPPDWVVIYYQARFGDKAISPEVQTALESRLIELSRVLGRSGVGG